MGRRASITPEQGAALLEAYGRIGTVAGAAREIGVSEDAAGRYLRDTPRAAAPVIVQQREVIEVAGASLFDTRVALEENFRGLQELLVQARSNDMANPKAVAAANNVFKEVREHIEAGTRMLELMLRLDETKKFQDAVLEAIGEADEPTQKRIIAKLQERRALGLALGGG